jgi:endonuclease III
MGAKFRANSMPLVQLPGVGRKTANVVLGSGFGIPSGVVVDTHVGRLSLRLGLTKQKDPVKVEHELMKLVPQDHWIDFSHELILHGRAVCDARKPKCEACALLSCCPQLGVTKTASGDDPQKIPAKIRLARMLVSDAVVTTPRSTKSLAPRTRKVSA